MDNQTLKRLIAAASAWRAENLSSESASLGSVLFYRGEICGWTRHVPEPRKWCPGVIALHVDGSVTIARGGNDDAGAEQFSPFV